MEKIDMWTESADGPAALEQLSALADGELDAARVAQACQHWRADVQLRSSWHAYHLIGDVLRSEDLAGDPARDARFMAVLRSRLADEPVVLAPPAAAQAPDALARPVGRTRRTGRSWAASSAVAAGFFAVAGVLFLTRAPNAGAPAVAVASGPAPAVAGSTAVLPGTLQAAAAPVSPVSPVSPVTPMTPGRELAVAADAQALVASGKLIRDLRLDRYLSAHKEFAGSSALGVPSGFLRNATADASDR